MSQPKETRSAGIKFSTGAMDVLFAFLIFAALALLSSNAGNEVSPSTPIEWWIKLPIACAAILVVATFGVFGADLDRRCAEDYVFQLIANAAVIAVFTTLLAHFLWDFNVLNEMGLPKPSSEDMLGVMLLSWSFGYYFYRFRGLKS